MRVLARLKGLRGGFFDVFGRTDERRMERRLLAEYEAMIDEILVRLAPHNLATAVELATIPEQIRGFGHVKERHVRDAKARETVLLAKLRETAPPAAPVKFAA